MAHLPLQRGGTGPPGSSPHPHGLGVNISYFSFYLHGLEVEQTGGGSKIEIFRDEAARMTRSYYLPRARDRSFGTTLDLQVHTHDRQFTFTACPMTNPLQPAHMHIIPTSRHEHGVRAQTRRSPPTSLCWPLAWARSWSAAALEAAVGTHGESEGVLRGL